MKTGVYDNDAQTTSAVYQTKLKTGFWFVTEALEMVRTSADVVLLCRWNTFLKSRGSAAHQAKLEARSWRAIQRQF